MRIGWENCFIVNLSYIAAKRQKGMGHNMKRLLVLLCMGLLLVGTTGCGKADSGGEDDSSQLQTTNTPEVSQTPEAPEASDAPPEGGNAVSDHDYEQGWTEQMESVKTAVTDLLGEDYWPNMALMPDMLESRLGISPDMYEDYFAEMPMISANVDTLIVIKAVEDQADAVEDILLAYHDNNVNNTMQYPQNVGKIQAARVERIGNYVIFSQLGADTTEVSEEGDQEVIIAHCREVNELVIEVISKVVEH